MLKDFDYSQTVVLMGQPFDIHDDVFFRASLFFMKNQSLPILKYTPSTLNPNLEPNLSYRVTFEQYLLYEFS